MAAEEPIVSTRGKVSKRDVEHAKEKTVALFDAAPKPVIKASIRLEHEANRRIERPFVAEATLDVSGRPVRAHVAAESMSEATDLLAHRLRRQLKELSERLIARNRRPRPEKLPPGEWRHGDAVGNTRPTWFERPAEERELLRRKTFALHAMTPDEAVFDMEMLHHDFYLFTNIDTDEENVITRADDVEHDYELIEMEKHDESLGTCAASIFASELTPPEVDVDTAVSILAADHAAFVFFKDADSGRGNVVYRRYDGHYGLITPAD